MTTTIPTTEGCYIWAKHEGAMPLAVMVHMAADGQTFSPGRGLCKDMGGSWDLQVSASKLEQAFEEGFKACQMTEERIYTLWLESRARKHSLGVKE